MNKNNLNAAMIILLSFATFVGCAHVEMSSDQPSMTKSITDELKPVKFEGKVDLKLKADVKGVEKVLYKHRSRSTSFEDVEVRKATEDVVEFLSQAETLKVDPKSNRFTQVISVLKKEGKSNLHDFAMPELGEKLEVIADSRGKILRAGDYPSNSIFYVPPISLPDYPVAIGDTWDMQSQWLSLEEMVPYRLEMTSILKNIWQCSAHKCAEIELSGEVGLQGPLVQMMAFKSLWKGFLVFDIDAGTVLWSRVDSEEQFMSGNVRRSVTSCLEALLEEPAPLKLKRNQGACSVLPNPGDITPIPAVTR